MITLSTGLPGAGKTLFGIWFVIRYQAAENKRLEQEAAAAGIPFVPREVYYSGIKNLTLPWTLIEPEQWPSCPPGSIIFIDECQTVFPKKPNGSTLPAHYQELATHRHHGFDMFIVTQHPSLIDNFVRKLVGRHFHSVRSFGMQRSVVYEWDKAVDTPDRLPSQKLALNNLRWSYPKEVFSYYKSAEVHTVKRSFPGKIVLGVLFVISMVFVFYFALDRYQTRTSRAGQASGGSGQVGAVSSASGGVVAAAVDPLADARRFVFESTPRVEGVAHTAPKYDQLTKPVRVPVPAMCIRKGDFCRCFSQQGTVLQTPTNMCLEIAHSGYFRDFDADGPQGLAATAVQEARSSVGAREVAQYAPAVAVMPYVPEPSRYAGATSSK